MEFLEPVVLTIIYFNNLFFIDKYNKYDGTKSDTYVQDDTPVDIEYNNSDLYGHLSGDTMNVSHKVIRFHFNYNLQKFPFKKKYQFCVDCWS